MDRDAWYCLAEVLVVVVVLSLYIVMHTEFFCHVEEQGSDWDFKLLGDVDVALANISSWIRVIDDHWFAIIERLSTNFHALFFRLEVVVVHSNIAGEVLRDKCRLAAPGCSDGYDNFKGSVLREILLVSGLSSLDANLLSSRLTRSCFLSCF